MSDNSSGSGGLDVEEEEDEVYQWNIDEDSDHEDDQEAGGSQPQPEIMSCSSSGSGGLALEEEDEVYQWNNDTESDHEDDQEAGSQPQRERMSDNSSGCIEEEDEVYQWNIDNDSDHEDDQEAGSQPQRERMSDNSSGCIEEEDEVYQWNIDNEDEDDQEAGGSQPQRERMSDNSSGGLEEENEVYQWNNEDEDDQGVEPEGAINPGVSLTGFLFGNVDTMSDKLEDPSIFGTDSDQTIRGLESLGIGIGLEFPIEEGDSENLRDPDPKTSGCAIIGAKTGNEESNNDSTPKEPAAPLENKLKTPLAFALPSKYAGVHVNTLFPDFRPDKVLRFTRLFGPGKNKSTSHEWTTGTGKKMCAKLKQKGDQVPTLEMETSESEPEADPSMCLPDQEEIFCRRVEIPKNKVQNNCGPGKLETQLKSSSLWRHGPAELWYDMLGLPDEPVNFDYGFKLKPKNPDSECDSDNELKKEPLCHFEPESFLMVNQTRWEDDIIWDKDDPSVWEKLKNMKTWRTGPLGSSRLFQNIKKPTPTLAHISSSSGSKIKKISGEGEHPKYSILPIESNELVKSYWEKEIIWDSQRMDYIPQPKIVELDPNDENIILSLPEDIAPNASPKIRPTKTKPNRPHNENSKILLGKAGVINVEESWTPETDYKDPYYNFYNISLDQYYEAPKHMKCKINPITMHGNIIHSTPAMGLKSPFIPTHMNVHQLRSFHRPLPRKFKSGPMSGAGPHSIESLAKHIQRRKKAREAELFASGGGDIFFMRTPEDLSGKDGELLLIEYSEEHPPLLNEVGMCSKLKNYYKRKAGTDDDGPVNSKYGEAALVYESPFLGKLYPGQMIQTIENNMYRSPIFPHKLRPSDFIIIRTKNKFYIRSVDGIFTAAQECPIMQVPGPNSKWLCNFQRDFLLVFIYRLFQASNEHPKRVHMSDIKRAFPLLTENPIRKLLKLCATFKRTGSDYNFWVIKPEFRLPSEEEVREIVSPEKCCAYFSFLAAEQRLKDAGYGPQSILAPDEQNESNQKSDDEIKAAPWNTTHAYIQAVLGKCTLQINGPADPTGCGEGFSYVKRPNKPHISLEEKETEPRRALTGTDADLRKLPFHLAKELLRKAGIPQEEIEKLSRWQTIDLVRTLSTAKDKAGEAGLNKFSRRNRFSVAEYKERYKDECQRIFELQNRVLESSEILSTDDNDSTEDDEDEEFEEMGKHIEKILSRCQFTHESEEAERQELHRSIMGEEKEKELEKYDEKEKSLDGLTFHPGRVLKIQRKYRLPDGSEEIRDEIVRNSHVIDIYTRIRTTKPESFIREFALIDQEMKEKISKEKRVIREQLRRIKKSRETEQANRAKRRFVFKPKPNPPPKPARKRKVKAQKPELKLKCGACGQVGHMKTNKHCPLTKLVSKNPNPFVKVDGTKIKLSAKLIKLAGEMKKKSWKIKALEEAISTSNSNDTKEQHATNLEPEKSTSVKRQGIEAEVDDTGLKSTKRQRFQSGKDENDTQQEHSIPPNNGTGQDDLELEVKPNGSDEKEDGEISD